MQCTFPEIHLWCYTCWPLLWLVVCQPSSFHRVAIRFEVSGNWNHRLSPTEWAIRAGSNMVIVGNFGVTVKTFLIQFLFFCKSMVLNLVKTVNAVENRSSFGMKSYRNIGLPVTLEKIIDQYCSTDFYDQAVHPNAMKILISSWQWQPPVIIFWNQVYASLHKLEKTDKSSYD